MRTALLLSGTAAMLALVPAIGSAQSPNSETEHVVRAGETLNGIANRAGVARDRIIKANGLKPPYMIRAGATLKIPRKPSRAASAAASARPATPAPNASSLANALSHVVQPGETLGGIALRARIPRVLIAEANGLAPPYKVRAGQQLVLPRTRRHSVAPGETGSQIAESYGVGWNKIAVANNLDPADTLAAGTVLLIPTVIDPAPRGTAGAVATQSTRFVWPATGPIRRAFKARGTGDYHDGLDIAAPLGVAVRASAAGTVMLARNDADEFGNLVVIDHGEGWHSAYGSLGRITVRQGHDVAQGERIGLVGNTSVTGRTELHFELRKDGKPVDPASKLPVKP